MVQVNIKYKVNLFFTVSKNETNLFDTANGNITVDFAENSKLKAESPHFVIVAGKTNEITFNLGNSGEMELISSSSGAQQSILSGNVTIKGGAQSTLILNSSGNDCPFGDGHWGGSGDTNIAVDTLKILSASDKAIMRASSAESLSITARNIYIKGRVQQGAGGKTEIKGFENLYIDGGSEYGLVSAAGALTIDGPGNITLTNDGSNAIIASRDSNGDLKLVGSTITLDGVGENSVGISGGKVGETSGAVSLKADVINVTAGKAIDISS